MDKHRDTSSISMCDTCHLTLPLSVCVLQKNEFALLFGDVLTTRTSSFSIPRKWTSVTVARLLFDLIEPIISLSVSGTMMESIIQRERERKWTNIDPCRCVCVCVCSWREKNSRCADRKLISFFSLLHTYMSEYYLHSMYVDSVEDYTWS